MKLYSVEEDYLRNCPYYTDSYNDIISQINYSGYENLPRVFVFHLLSGMSSGMSSLRSPLLPHSNFSDAEIWTKLYQKRVSEVSETHSVKELLCFIRMKHSSQMLKLSTYLPLDKAIPRIPPNILDYESAVIRNDISRKQDAYLYKSMSVELETVLGKYYAEQEVATRPQFIFSTPNVMQDKFGLTRVNVESMMVPTRSMGTLCIMIKNYIYPDNLLNYQCRRINKAEPLFFSITGQHHCLLLNMGSIVYEDSLPIPIDKMPKPNEVISFARKDYYGLNNENIENLINKTYF